MEGTDAKKKDTAKKTIINVGELLKKPYLNEMEVAAVTGRAVSTLRNERHLRRGLPYLKIGKRSIRYKTADTLAFMEGRRISFDGK
jgi:hypothetical protein